MANETVQGLKAQIIITGQWSAADANSCALQILSVDVVG